MSAIPGIDIAKASFDVALNYEQSSYYQTFANDPQGFMALRVWMAELGVEQAHVALEATGRYGDALASDLFGAGFKVSFINARYLKAFRDSLGTLHKTDKQDAALLARFCAERQPAAWQPPSPVLNRLKQLTRHLQNLQGMLQQERNRLQSGLTDSFVKAHIETHIAFLEAEMAAFRKQIQLLISRDDLLQQNYQLIISIPGIADKTAPILLAEIGDIQRFASAKALASYAGLTPIHYQSGSSVQRPGRLSKRGNSHLRTALYMPAMGAPRWNRRCAALKRRLKDKGKKGKSIIAANMHLLLRLVYGVLKHQTPYDPRHLQNLHSAA